MRVSWTAKRSNQSILKEINSEYTLEGLMLKLKLLCFDHLMQMADSLEVACKESACNAEDLGPIPGLGRSAGEGKDYPLEKTLILGKIEGRRRRG